MSNFIKIFVVCVVCCCVLWYNGYMKLWYDRKSKDPTYFIQLGVRNGKKTTTKNVARIGKHSELLKITDDPLAYAKEQVKKYNEEYKKENKVSLDLKVDFAEKIKATDALTSKSTQRNIGYFFLQQIYHELEIHSFFKNVTSDMKIEFDPNLVNRFMIYSRILNPDSKLGAHQNLSLYYEQPDFDYVHILRTMDIMKDHYEEYIRHLFEKSCNIIKRDTSVCFYDCTNYYFETEIDDEDYVDEVTGETIKGLRKYGPSKEHRPNPIVEMGLFMDRDGIPLSMCITSGSDNEQTTAIPLEQQMTKMLKGKKFIYCADAGLGSFNIRNFNSMGGRAFIVTQSIKKLSDPLKEAVFNDFDYRLLSTDEGERKGIFIMKKIISVLLAALMVTSAFAAPKKGGKVKVGVSMPTKDLQRWNQDGANMKKTLEKQGYVVDLQYANNDIATQVSQVENMISTGSKVLVIASIDGTALSNVLFPEQINRNQLFHLV